MKVNAISFSAINNISETKNNKRISTISKDKIQFTGFEKTISDASRKTFKNDSEVEETFKQIFNAILKDSNIIKEASFNIIIDTYKQEGFRGLMNELWKAYTSDNFIPLINSSEGHILNLAQKDDKPVVELINYGRHGFWNAINDTEYATRDVRLSFSYGKNSIEFYLDKKGDCSLLQNYEKTSIYSGYYKSTGNKKFQTEHYSECRPETTYYNKDGSKAFFKNWFYGGPAIEPIF